MGIMSTIGSTKACRSIHDELLIKEVILAYCGTTESIDIGEPSEPVEPLPPIIDPEIPEEPEEPELPPEEQPGWDVSVLNPEFTGWQITNSYLPGIEKSEKFIIQIWNFEGEWAVVKDGNIIVTHETRKDNSIGFYFVETSGSGTVYTIEFASYPGEYRVYGRCSSIHTGIDDYYNGPMTRKTVIDRYSLYASWQRFGFQNTGLTVPRCMPPNITTTQEMFRNSNYYTGGEPDYCRINDYGSPETGDSADSGLGYPSSGWSESPLNITGTNGRYLTVRKSPNSVFIKFDVSIPEDAEALRKLLITGPTDNTIAFVQLPEDAPETSNEYVRVITGISSDGTIPVNGYLNGYNLMDGVTDYQGVRHYPPFNFVSEVISLEFKSTSGVSGDEDIFRYGGNDYNNGIAFVRSELYIQL